MLKDKLLDSPLDEWLKVEWPQFSANLISVRARREDVLLYVLWALDGLKSDEEYFVTNFWNNLREQLRNHFFDYGMNANPTDLDYMTNVVSALVMGCLGLALKDDFDNQSRYSILVNRIGNHWQAVSNLKKQLSFGTHSKRLEPWIVAYMQSDLYLTVADEMDWDDTPQLLKIDFQTLANSETHSYLPAMLPLEKTKGLYLLLCENSIIENNLTEEDFLQLFGNRRSIKVLAPVRWLANKDDLLLLLRSIYDHWSEKSTISQNKLMQIAHTLFVGKKGKPYSSSMKMKASYKGENPVITNFLATI